MICIICDGAMLPTTLAAVRWLGCNFALARLQFCICLIGFSTQLDDEEYLATEQVYGMPLGKFCWANAVATKVFGAVAGNNVHRRPAVVLMMAT